MILLDTHVTLWLASQPEKLSKGAVFALETARDKGDCVAISSVTLFEIAQLALKQRIYLTASAELVLQQIENQFTVKSITARICAEILRLPETYPKDPLDRIIGATAIVEEMTLITADIAIHASKAVPTLW